MSENENSMTHRGHKGPFKLLAVVGAIYLAILSWNAWKQHDYIGRPVSQRDVISIGAEGKVTAIPDVATVSIGVETERDTVGAAQEEATKKMNAILARLKELGIASEDLKTTGYSIYPVYDYPNGRQVERGYHVSQTVQAKIRDLDTIGEILAASTSLGANQIGGVNFTIDEPEAIEQEARLEALSKAKAKAEALAEAAGVKLGKVVGFSESVNGGPVPYYARELGFGAGGDSAATPPSIEAGSQDVVVNVSVMYEILP